MIAVDVTIVVKTSSAIKTWNVEKNLTLNVHFVLTNAFTSLTCALISVGGIQIDCLRFLMRKMGKIQIFEDFF